MDTLDDYMLRRPPTASRPLLGLTVLVVEDSRFASEALRLLCQRSGARIRRADTLASARRHLMVYRPGAILIDMGLPDGPGAALIGELAAASPRIDVILGISGDPDLHKTALAAGADGFIAKPLARLADFQRAILRHLPQNRHPAGLQVLSDDSVTPDPLAYRDDLCHVAEVLQGSDAGAEIDYLTQFLGGVAHSAGDAGLCAAVEDLALCHRRGGPPGPELARLSALVKARLAAGPMI
ncbi:MAG: response regulator [Rubellimicrobium sp.]|nr:response regulator [Rubellimicrobium sp.]